MSYFVVNQVCVEVVNRPARKLILKRGVKASSYFEYCEEVGCDVWSVLSNIEDGLYEPVGMWMPRNFREEGTSEYVQGVEVPFEYSRKIPDGFEIMELPSCLMMIFKGQAYDDADFHNAIAKLEEFIENFVPESIGFQWAEGDGPRFQFEPKGYRGYIGGRPVRKIG